MIYEQRIKEVTITEVSDVPKKRKICDHFRLKSHNGVADMPPGISVSPAENGVQVREKKKMSSPKERREESEKPEVKKTPENESPPHRVREEFPPSREEFEAFFARHQKERLKRFREKYNFDFEKEEALEGRYKWVQIHEN